MFTGSEAWNRASTFLAAYRRAKAAGDEDPVGTAGHVVQTAHFIYGRGNRPQIVRKLGARGKYHLHLHDVSLVEAWCF